MKTQYTETDILRGWRWYTQHKTHIELICAKERREFPMSGSDISHPELWKPGAWLWFFRNYGPKPQA